MNHEEYISFLVSGFVREEIEDKHKLPIPQEIKHLISDVLNQMNSFILNVCTINKDVIKQNGRVFKTEVNSSENRCVSAGDSKARTSGTFTIKIITIQTYIAVGITSAISNITDCQRQMYSWKAGKTYYVHGGNSDGYCYEAGMSLKWKHSGFKEGDIIKVEWNDIGNLRFYTNGKEIGKIDIVEDLAYHPCVQHYHRHGKIELELV